MDAPHAAPKGSAGAVVQTDHQTPVLPLNHLVSNATTRPPAKVPRASAAEVAALLSESMLALVHDLAGKPSQIRGHEWRFGRRGSRAVMVAGPKCGSWFDHEANQGGDALALVAHVHRMSTGEALKWSLTWLGRAGGANDVRPPLSSAPTRQARPREAVRPATLDLARQMWREALPADSSSSLVPAYLAARGLVVPDTAALRYHPCAWRNAAYGPHGPAMVALMTDPATNKPCGVHL
jgi:hypothetical protein